MPIIRLSTHKARKPYRCDDCHQAIPVGDRYHRLFGMAHKPDKPYEVMIHLGCLRLSSKERAALKEAVSNG